MLQTSIRISLLLASRIVPDSLRASWLRKWVDGLPHFALWLRDRGYDGAEIRQRLRGYTVDGWREARALRWPEDEFSVEAYQLPRTPWSVLALALCVLAAGVAASRGFALMRASFTPLPAGLVTAQPGHSYFGKRPGFTARQFFRLAERAQSYQQVAGYSTQRLKVGPAVRQVAIATPELFALLNLPEGVHGAGADQSGAAVEILGRRHTVTQAWPRDLRVGLSRPDYWLAMSAEEIEQRGFDMTLIARLRPGISAGQATAELRDILLSVPARRGTGNPSEIVPLTPGLAALFGVLWRGYVAVLLGLAGWAAYCLWRRGRGEWRKQLFLLALTVPMLTGLLGLAGVWAGIPGSGSSAGAFWVLWWSATIAALLIWWALRDNRVRCPECLTRMTRAVQIGTHANPLLEGVGDELLCEHGHGALWMPAVQAQAFGPEVWRGSSGLD